MKDYLKRIDDFRFENRCKSRFAATLDLFLWVLKAFKDGRKRQKKRKKIGPLKKMPNGK
jgi:hypothetical protein